MDTPADSKQDGNDDDEDEGDDDDDDDGYAFPVGEDLRVYSGCNSVLRPEEALPAYGCRSMQRREQRLRLGFAPTSVGSSCLLSFPEVKAVVR